jgi:hypothetical protein
MLHGGVRWKHFERVVAALLQDITPLYVRLPPFSPAALVHKIWPPFANLPSAARVWGVAPGQLSCPQRAERKEAQLLSMMRCILPLVSEKRQDEAFTIVDFGGGSGHLGIPLALLLPNCRVIVVDFNQRSLRLLQTKVETVMRQLATEGNEDQPQQKYTPSTAASLYPSEANELGDRFWSCGEKCQEKSTCSTPSSVLGNLFAFQGPVEDFSIPFDMALALHLCGEATDVAIRKSMAKNAAAMVMAPCCVGKLSRKALNPDVFNATGQNERAVSYPQSTVFCQLVGKDNGGDTKASFSQRRQKDDWDALAKAADYSNEQECGTHRNATRRTAKALLETDRRLFLEEQIGHDCQYHTALMRMDPLDATPKNDILVAWRKDLYDESVQKLFSVPDPKCQQDIQVAKSQLLMSPLPDVTSTSESTNAPNDTGRSDWTAEEEKEIEQKILDFLEQTKDMDESKDQILLFPTRMGGRKRKLIHFVADRMNLAHWSHGSKDSEKTVAIARRGQRKKRQDKH